MSAIAGRVLILPKGDYDASVTYEFLDLVNHNSSSWLAKKASTGIEPSDANSEFWQRFGAAVSIATEESVGTVRPDGETITIDENGVISSVGGTAENVTYENESVLDVINVKEALDGIFDGTQQVGDSAKLGGKALNDIVLQEAKHVYVSPNGSDENGDGTQENPWKTIQKAVNECPVTADNNHMYSVHLENGVYIEYVDVRRKVIRLYATDTENPDITINGNISIQYNSVFEIRTPLVIDALNSVPMAINVANNGNLTILSPITVKHAKEFGLSANANSNIFVNSKTIIEECVGGFFIESASIAHINEAEIKNCNIGISLTYGGIATYGSASFTNVATQYVTSNGGRIYTGAQNELTTANKPSGTYTGNGSATERVIETGGIGNEAIVYSTIGITFLTPNICFTVRGDGSPGTVIHVPTSEAYCVEGRIVLNSTAVCLNNAGGTYRYRIL